MLALLLAAAALAAASPILGPRDHQGPPPACAIPPPPGPTLPVNGGSSELPAPAQGLELKHIALGWGIQNYTCSSPGAAPASTGALASLYDITALYPGQGPDSLTLAEFESLTTVVVSGNPIPVNLAPLPLDRFAASPSNPFPAPKPLHVPGFQRPMMPLGHHFFDAQGNPVFDLDSGETHLVAAKDASVDAPASANRGPEGTGAVAWLALAAKDGAASTGARFVYRVVTAGGNPHGCAARAGQDSTPYAAQYWFYG